MADFKRLPGSAALIIAVSSSFMSLDGPQAYLHHLENRPVSRRANMMWIAGAVLGACLLAVGLIAKPLTGPTQGRPLANDEHEVVVSHLQVGDCIYDIVEKDETSTLPEVPCTDPHKGEVVGQFPVQGRYPGHLVIPDGFHERCQSLFAAYAPDLAGDHGYDVAMVLPSAAQWADPNYRITCIALSHSAHTGSIA